MRINFNNICLGKVGSGKSSLLNALVGEMHRISGKLAINANDFESGIAIVTQEAWIQNATVMENILFGKPFNSQRYHSVLDACALVDDINVCECDYSVGKLYYAPYILFYRYFLTETSQ